MKRTPSPDTPVRSNQMTRVDVATRLGVSVSTVRRYEGTELHPTAGADGINRFDAAEVAALASKLVADREARPSKARPRNARKVTAEVESERPIGEVAAEVFKRFEQRHSLAEIVIGVRVSPQMVRELHREWQRGLVEGELESDAPVLLAGEARRASERPVDEATLVALLAAFPEKAVTRLSIARDLGTDYETEGGPVRRLVELGGFNVRGPATIEEIVARYGHGAYRITAFGVDPAGLRWEVLATISRPGSDKKGR